MDRELTGLPESLGTKKCYFCQCEDPSHPDGSVWNTFIEYQGKLVSVPICSKCDNEKKTKKDCVCLSCKWVGNLQYETHFLERTEKYIKMGKCPKCGNEVKRFD